MPHSPSLTTLDLHGRRAEDAISAVTSFLERIRRTVAPFTRKRPGGQQNVLFVTIITGSGSHSPHGPVLRIAVEKLLQKRGMSFSLERGGGAFKVDALSGWDLHDPGPATESKVVLAERNEFHQLASARRRTVNAGNYATMAQCTAESSGPRRNTITSAANSGPPHNITAANNFGPPRNISVPNSSNNRRGSNPLPSQVASEDADIRTATRLSSNESQQQRSRQYRMNDEYERQYKRAVSQSQLDYAEPRQNEAKIEEEESQVQMALERSVEDSEHRQLLTEEEYEEALIRSMEQSTKEVNMSGKGETKASGDAELAGNNYEEEQLRAALEKSAEETKMSKASEEDLIEQALAESMALTEAGGTDSSEDDLEANISKASEGMRLSRKQFEDEQLRVALEKSTEETKNTEASEDDLIEQALAESRALAKADESNTSEDDFLEKALAESLLEEERWKASEHEAQLMSSEGQNISEDEILEKALAESLLEEERRKAAQHEISQDAGSESSEEEERILQEVIRLSLIQEEKSMTEEEAMEKAIEMSKQIR